MITDYDDFSGSFDTNRWQDGIWLGSGDITGVQSGGVITFVGSNNSTGSISSIATYGASMRISAKLKLTGKGWAFLFPYVDENNCILFGPYKNNAGTINELAMVSIHINGVTRVIQLKNTAVDGAFHTYEIRIYSSTVEFYLDSEFLASLPISQPLGTYHAQIACMEIYEGATFVIDDYLATDQVTNPAEVQYTLAGKFLDPQYTPFIKAERTGQGGFWVLMQQNKAFEPAIMAACPLGATVTMTVTCSSGTLVYTGTVFDVVQSKDYAYCVMMECSCSIQV